MSTATIHSTLIKKINFCEGTYNTTNNVHLFVTSTVSLVTEWL